LTEIGASQLDREFGSLRRQLGRNGFRGLVFLWLTEAIALATGASEVAHHRPPSAVR